MPEHPKIHCRSRLAGAALLLVCLLLTPTTHGHGGHDHGAGPTMNHHAIDDDLQTGGHFVGDGLQAVADEGVSVVIDLRDEPPAGQGEKLAAVGIEWINVPVSFGDPRPEDYAAFAQAMQAHGDAKVLVQCQANYRASAFAFLYRVKEQGVSERKAREDLEAVWTPAGKWGRYVEAVLEN